MFKLLPEATFSHDVKFRVPVDGGFEEQAAKVTYRVLDAGKAESFDLDTIKGGTEFLRAAVARIDGIVDGEGAPVAWNDGVAAQVLGLPYTRGPLSRGYWEAVTGAKTGN